MTEPLGYSSRSILEYVPDIEYVEPDVVSEEPEDLHKEHVSPDDNLAKAKAVQKLAQNIEKIAENVQKQADKLSTGFDVELNTNADNAAIMAMRRHYPNDNPVKITYEHYKQCKDHLRELANGVSDKVLNNLSEDNITKEAAIANSGDREAMLETVRPNKTNRPEEDTSAELIEPVDIAEFQDNMLRHLANLLWKKFVKPVIPLPPGVSFLPDEIAPLPKGSPTPEKMMGQD